jgi:copper resistance protein D
MMEDDLVSLLVAARAVHFAAASSLAGALCFRLLVAEPAIRWTGAELTSGSIRFRARLARIVWLSFALTLASGAAWFALLAVEMSGGPVAEALTTETLRLALTATQAGAAWGVRFILLLALGVVLAFDRRLFGSALLACAVLAGLAWCGHAGAGQGAPGAVHAASDVLHLIASGLWLGGLLPLALFLARGRDPEAGEIWAAASVAATRRFSIIGLISVGVLIATGAVNAWMLVATLPALFGTPYGHLLLVKIGLFLLMLGVAAFNRLRLTPALTSPAGHARAARRLIRNCLIETVLGLGVLTAVAAFGVLPPGAHVQPDWPFPLRLNPLALSDPALRTPSILALTKVAAAALVLATGLFGARWLSRRQRAPLALSGLAALVWFTPDLKALTLEAHPTSFQTSPTHYSSQGIAEGAALFARHCASCHGANGEGTGGTKDLTRHEAHAALPGDRFWAISSGAGAAMPGFASTLDALARWRLVDYLHALGDAAHLRMADGAVTPAAFQTPGFSADCPDGANAALEELRGHVLRLVMSDGAAAAPAPVSAAEVTTIILPLEGTARRSGVCVAGDTKVTAAMAVYVGGRPLDGAELLVDALGSLRFAWRPGEPGARLDPATLRRLIEEIRRTPGIPVAAQARHH